ncbi:MAG: hypothetical protein WDO56_30915 [Gammaproteobacteria bacterium]
MTSPHRSVVFALLAMGAMNHATAQKTVNEMRTVTLVLESPSGSVLLPSGVGGSVTMPPCGGCVPKNFPVTQNSKFFLRQSQVTLAELKSAIAGRPDLLLGVAYSVKTGEIVSIRGEFDAPVADRNRNR